MKRAGFSEYFRPEDGAVTVDWVVLTASIIALCLTVTALIFGSSSNIASHIGSQKIMTTYE